MTRLQTRIFRLPTVCRQIDAEYPDRGIVGTPPNQIPGAAFKYVRDLRLACPRAPIQRVKRARSHRAQALAPRQAPMSAPTEAIDLPCRGISLPISRIVGIQTTPDIRGKTR
jgi:hypothetical protein